MFNGLYVRDKFKSLPLAVLVTGVIFSGIAELADVQYAQAQQILARPAAAQVAIKQGVNVNT